MQKNKKKEKKKKKKRKFSVAFSSLQCFIARKRNVFICIVASLSSL